MNDASTPSLHLMMTVNAAWNILNFRMPLVRGLLARHRVTILAPPDGSEAQLQAAGCRFLPLEMNAKGLNPREDFALMLRFGRIFAAEKPDLVMGFTIKNNLFGAMAAKRRGIAFLPNVTGLGTAFLSGGALQKLAGLLYRHAFSGLPCVFFQNDDDRALFLSRRLVAAGQAQLLPGSGIDLAHFAPAPPLRRSGPPVFLMIARLLRDKGVVEYVEAARMIRRSRPDIRFQLLGPTGAENRSAIPPETLAGWQAEGVIDYLGSTTDVRPMIAAADCIVLPSYREGAPRTLIEAGAMARPVIASDVPGCRSVVADGETGLLCPPRDAAGLAAAFDRFLTLSPAQREAMGRAGRTRMERHYDQHLVLGLYETAITQALAGGRG